MATVVVTGAAGSLGRRVVERLAGAPGVDRVVGVDMVPAERFPPAATPVVVDLADPGEGVAAVVQGAFAGADGIIHLAWRTADGYGRSALPTAEANHRSLRRVTESAALSAPASLVHLSSATVYGAWPDNPVPLPEEAPLRPNPELAFAVEKAEAERALADWAEEHPDVAVAVLRPAATVGSPERPLYRALGGTGAPGEEDRDQARPVQFLHVDDLADAVVLAWQRRLRGAYNVAPDGGTADDTARALAGGVARLRLPSRAASAVGSWSWSLWRFGVPRSARAYVTHPWVVAPDRLKAAGWTPRYSSEEALVAADDRTHWDDLPPGRRQGYALLAVAGGLSSLVAAGGLAAWRLRRRRFAGLLGDLQTGLQKPT